MVISGLPSQARPSDSFRYAMVDAWHPGIMLAYGAIVMLIACVAPSMPLLLVCLLCGCALLLQTERTKGLRTAVAAFALGCAVTLLAPVFDTAGDQMLFMLFGRPYTFEALMRGVLTGSLVASMLVWFSCLSRIVGGDGILQLTARVAPRIGMVTSLVMQMVPQLTRRAARVRSARIGAGLVPSSAGAGDRLHEAGALFATVASDSLERSVVCADAMESRGYGTGPRTRAQLAPYSTDEKAFIVLAIVCAVAFCGAFVVSAIEPSPSMSAAPTAAYAALCALPVLFNAAEDIRWRI